MEPRQEVVPSRGELPSVSVESVEKGATTSLEQKTGASIEHELSAQNIGAAQAAVQAVAPALPTPVITTQSNAVNEDTSVPVSANDDDLIEKEWVDQAKRIIAETKDDPYKREREVSKLQIEYIRRRYGREIGDSGD